MERKAIMYDELVSELDKKDIVIDAIAEELRYQKGMGQDDMFCYDICKDKQCDKDNCKERIKQYFKKEGEEK